MDTTTDVLTVEGYTLQYRTGTGTVTALKGVDLAIKQGKTVGLVGESGSGKSSLAWAIMRYLPNNAVEVSGTLNLSGENLRQKTKMEVLAMRGRDIAMVFQDPDTSLNPSLRLGDQLQEVLVRHRSLSVREAQSESLALLDRTGIARPADMMRRYPHEASGGEKQRVVIATALACQPRLIIFDEPTTALDIITARQIIDLFTRLREQTGVTALYISHDLGLVARVADTVAVINQGEIVEHGPCAETFSSPQADHTRALMDALPRPDHRITNLRPADCNSPILSIRDLTVVYGEKPPLLQRLRLGRAPVFGAGNVSFSVAAGEILGIVGESGSGKSTIARAITGLKDFAGTISFDGRTFDQCKVIDRNYRRNVQIIFQHPDASLNPRQTIGEILSRPLKLYGIVAENQVSDRVSELLRMVLLPEEFAMRHPYQLSGGEKQRIAIARAFAAEPKVVICDEITSSLDVSVQASVVKLLVSLQQSSGTACLFITHDINLVLQLAHRVAVMLRGDLVDIFPVAAADSDERHTYTRALLDAVPQTTPWMPDRVATQGEIN